MTRLRNELVLEKWKDGESAASHNGALHTDGRRLVFIQTEELVIAPSLELAIVGDFTSPGGQLCNQ